MAYLSPLYKLLVECSLSDSKNKQKVKDKVESEHNYKVFKNENDEYILKNLGSYGQEDILNMEELTEIYHRIKK